MDLFDSYQLGMEPPKVPPRKEKRPKVKQDVKPRPYIDPSPAPRPLSALQPIDKLGRELQQPQPYTAESDGPPRPSAQDKLQRERVRALAGTGSSPGPSHPNSSRASLPPSYRSTSPAPTFTSLPPYTPSPPGFDDQSQPQARERTQRRSMFRRWSRASTRSESLPQEVDAPPDATSPRALPSIPLSAASEEEDRERVGVSA
ncbi:hypothetical protein PENSPDRAFT_649508 [Peniophora sp. CONT]|nr:hypothetical protein PENSPDRAFT_649508 [Peniophora sp. CONT]